MVFVPKHLISQPDGYEVLIEDASYSRIPGNWIIPPRRTAIDMHPITPYKIFFETELKFSLSLHSNEALKVKIRVYDQFGLALTTNVSLAIPGLEIISSEKVSSPGTMRRPSITAF